MQQLISAPAIAHKPLLSAEGIAKKFGEFSALDDVNIDVPTGSVTGLIGPNGAGKTTLFDVLSHFSSADRGQVIFNDKPIAKLATHRIAWLGMVRTFQVTRVLSRLSVLENLLLATPKQVGEHFWPVFFKSREIEQQERENREMAMGILSSVGLADHAGDYAGGLSGGQRKLLELARVLMTHPKLILLDEPTAGVSPTLTDKICDHILEWNRQGISFLIVEHKMDVIMSVCDRVWVLNKGRNIADGTPKEIQNNPSVVEAYLGG